MNGHLHLGFDAPEGRTVLREQSFSAPMHISKPYWDGVHLIVNAVNPTAGLFAGDTIHVTLRVKTGAKAVFTTPSASRVYRARNHVGTVLLKQEIEVQAGGWLDFCPEMLIPHAGSRSAQQTHITVRDGGGLLFVDSLAPGRLASGEAFAFESLRWESSLRVEDKLVARENYRLAPRDGSLQALSVHYPHTYYASGFFVFPGLTADMKLKEKVAAAGQDGALAGASYVAPNALTFKVLSESSIVLRRTVATLRDLFYSVIAQPQPKLRKL